LNRGIQAIPSNAPARLPMNDDVPTSRSRRRERAIAATRERLRRVEIETHRIKAELARLESENETDLADELADELRLEGVSTADSAPGACLLRPTQPPTRRDDLGPRQPVEPRRAATPQIIVANGATAGGHPAAIRAAAQRRKKVSPAWLLSLGAHLVILLLLAPLTYVILTNDQTPLFASMFDPAVAQLDEPGTAPIELVSYEEPQMPANTVEQAAGLAESVRDELAPVASALGGETARNLGQLNTLPTDVGTLMAGTAPGDANLLGGGRRRGAADDEARLGATSFFGTPARANRVVFLVDNSASMKQGRMETTLFELARSVEALGEKQEFYVAFYSDQVYPMLFPASVMEPLAATRENKQRLFRWLETVELCTGGALLKAVELAESLRPQVVYVLSDGDISGTVTIEKLTRPSDRKFAIHTLGMGVKKPQDAQILLAIARANRGTFQMVRPLPAAVQSAKAHPILSNASGVSWGEKRPLGIR